MTIIKSIRTTGAAAALSASLLVLAGCASAPPQTVADSAPATASDAPADAAQIEAANDSSTAIRAATDEGRQAYRDCVRRVRRTGSRLARSECESAIFGGGFHSMNEAKTAPAGTITENR
jgi:hypothetical protein